MWRAREDGLLDDLGDAGVNPRRSSPKSAYRTDDSNGWVKRIIPFSRSITRAATAGSSASAATPARSSRDTDVVPTAAAKASALRVDAGSAEILALTSSSTVSGTGSG